MFIPKRESHYRIVSDDFTKLASFFADTAKDAGEGGVNWIFGLDSDGKPDNGKPNVSPYMVGAGGLAGGLAGYGVSTLARNHLGEDLGYAPEILGALGGAYLSYRQQRDQKKEEEEKE